MNPRSHAAEILKLPTREQRQERLKLVPDKWKLLVETHVRNAYELRKKN